MANTEENQRLRDHVNSEVEAARRAKERGKASKKSGKSGDDKGTVSGRKRKLDASRDLVCGVCVFLRGPSILLSREVQMQDDMPESSLRFTIGFPLKRQLVDDWENITQKYCN